MAPNTLPNPLVAIIGATGTGKSKLAVSLAQKFNGEIINGDAMQMYQGLPIITNKIPVAERGGVPHHLIDMVGYDEPPWHVGTFVRESLKLTKAIHQRGKLPILVGGTQYYTKGLLFKESLVNDAIEEKNGHASETEGPWPILSASTPEILAKLREVDPIMAGRWHPNERRKICRSLEIWLLTGRPASEIYAEQNAAKSAFSPDPDVEEHEDSAISGGLRFRTLILWLKAEKNALNTRLDTRVNEMIDEGLIQESESLYDFVQRRKHVGIEDDLTRGIWVSIGYKELLNYIAMSRQENASSKQMSDLKEESIERIKIATRQYAKRQDRFIRLRLMGDIVRFGILKNLFVLDCSNIATQEDDVIPPAFSITEMFLQRKELPDAKEISTLAKETLSSIPEKPVNRSDGMIPQCHTCETCGKVLETLSAWESHLKSRRHQQIIAAQNREASRCNQPNGEGNQNEMSRSV